MLFLRAWLGGWRHFLWIASVRWVIFFVRGFDVVDPVSSRVAQPAKKQVRSIRFAPRE
jgi:hypothetical protein